MVNSEHSGDCKPTLPNGVFFGAEMRTIRTADFSVTLHRSRVDELNCAPHIHADAHFLIPWHRGYQSDAWKFDPDSTTVQLIYSPPRTEHCDSMARPGGLFSAISLSSKLLESLTKLGRVGESVAHSDLRITGLAHRAVCLATMAAPEASDIEAACLDLCAAFEEPAPSPAALGARTFRRALELMDANRDVGVAEIARRLGLHPVYFARSFRRRTGLTPSRYMNLLRVERAAEKVRKGDMNLAEIAATEGFCDQSHLTRTFKRALGISPSTYRAVLFE